MLARNIVAIGSSSLFGLVDPKHGGYIGRLKTWHEANDVNNKVYNLGISGDTTSGMLKRLSNETSVRKPDLILITTGLNDTRRVGSKESPSTTPIAQFEQNLKSLISEASRIAKVACVGVYPIDDSKTAPLFFWKKDYYYLMADAKDYERVTSEICKSENIPYLDIFNEWLRQDYANLLFEDGLHANELGHQKIFESLKQFLLDLYK